jgi:hypothetical protein
MPSSIYPIVLVDVGPTFIETSDPSEARVASAVFRAQWRYVHGTGTRADLYSHRGIQLAGETVETDPDALDEWARRGEFDLAEVYRELFS